MFTACRVRRLRRRFGAGATPSDPAGVRRPSPGRPPSDSWSIGTMHYTCHIRRKTGTKYERAQQPECEGLTTGDTLVGRSFAADVLFSNRTPAKRQPLERLRGQSLRAGRSRTSISDDSPARRSWGPILERIRVRASVLCGMRPHRRHHRRLRARRGTTAARQGLPADAALCSTGSSPRPPRPPLQSSVAARMPARSHCGARYQSRGWRARASLRPSGLAVWAVGSARSSPNSEEYGRS